MEEAPGADFDGNYGSTPPVCLAGLSQGLILVHLPGDGSRNGWFKGDCEFHQMDAAAVPDHNVWPFVGCCYVLWKGVVMSREVHCSLPVLG